MSKVLMTGTARIKKNTPLSNNIDDDILVPFIVRAQETHIQQILGTDLYLRLLEDIKTSAVSGNYATLLNDYVLPTLVEYTFYEALPFVSLKFTNKSVGRQNADYFDPASLDDVKYLRQTIKDAADFYAQRLILYLKQYQGLYPEYSQNNTMDKLRPQSNGFFGGVYLGGGRSTTSLLGDKWVDLN